MFEEALSEGLVSLEIYSNKTIKNVGEYTLNIPLEKFAVEKFGDKAGIAQQYIFYAARQGELSIKQ